MVRSAQHGTARGRTATHDDGYREWAAPAALADQWACVWSARAPAGEAPSLRRILPDTCVDIICVGDGAPTVAGPATVVLVAAIPAGSTIVGVRLRPGVAASWLGAPMDEARNASLPLAAFWGARARGVHDAVASAAPGRRLGRLVEAVAARRAHLDAPDALVERAVGRILGASVDVPVGRLARDLEVSERHLLRRFRARVGYGPKTLERIVRLQRLLRLSRTGTGDPDLAALALDAGYADQAHMSREVRDLSGLSPAALLGRRRPRTVSESFKPDGSPSR